MLDTNEFGIFKVGLELNKGSTTLRDQRLLFTYGPYLPSLLYCEPKLNQFYLDQMKNPQKPDSVAPRGNLSSDNDLVEINAQLPCGNTEPCFNLCDSNRNLRKQLNASGNSIEGTPLLINRN